MKTCPNCAATDLPDKAKVCGHCGTRVDKPAVADTPQADKTDSGTNSDPTESDSVGEVVAAVDESVPLLPPPPTPTSSRIAEKMVNTRPKRPLPLLAAVGLVVSALLPWFSVGGFTLSSFDVSIGYLWNGSEASGGLPLGWLLMVLAAGVAAVALAREARAKLARGLAIGAFVVPIAFLGQTQAEISDLGNAPNLLDWIGIGAWLALVSGLLIGWWGWRRS